MTIATFQEGDESPNVRYTDNGDGSYTPIIDVGASIALSGTISAVGPNLSTGKNIGRITVVTAGTAVQGENIPLTNGVFLKALTTNSGICYVGNNGSNTVTAASGYPLSTNDVDIWQVSNLNELWFNSSSSGDKIAWHKG